MDNKISRTKPQIFDVQDLVRPNVKKMKPYSSARDEFKEIGANMVFIDANENPFETGLNRYPDPHQRELKQLISNIKKFPESQILLGNGSDEVLDLLFRAFCEPKQDNIIILPPTYGMYKVLAELNDVQYKSVLLTDDFQLKVSRILDTADEFSKLLFICSPNNPSGNCFKKNDIEDLLQNFKGIVVIDEAYVDFTGEDSWIQRLNEFPNLVVCQTLSKAYGLAGIRLGMCFASEDIINILKKIKPPYNVNQLTQQKAKEIIGENNVGEDIQLILKGRKKLLEDLDQINFVRKIYPTDANFVLVKVDDANKRYVQLVESGVVVRNRSNQELCDNCLRLTVGTPDENEKLINKLKELL
ncbi:histidinol-phosphate transaminase [Aegicerativicinus sediminis]|uniref:histidinol-phosphate transaminase n=1 Tax=Aegicerativicinus sediminis TaxID=2893202 RepID=UPI001E42106C|nr:histidinol-phosphate transaminase [Aegicerativicinus sediminis]